MKPSTPLFDFIEKGAPAPIQRGELVAQVRLPAGITRKRQLLSSLASVLQFPNYFGHNWDALEECLNDLSWFGESKTVCLMHADLPCAENSETLAIYLDILSKRVQTETKKNGVKLRVCFPATTREAVQAVLAK